jgi:polyphenol oxidase
MIGPGFMAGWVRPDWPAPDRVRAVCTTRTGGCSDGAWSSLNLGERCGDDPQHVRRNRERLLQHLPAPPQWLRQVHGAAVARHPGVPGSGRGVEAGAAHGAGPEADALVAFAPGQVCAVLTADCLPVFFCDRAGSRVAVAHAGWRGLAGGVLEATVRALETEPAELLAWLGPAIGPAVYEVGEDVAGAFREPLGAHFPDALTARGDRWLLDLYAAARLRLAAAGLREVHGGGLCTYSDPARFYSHRRDGVTGRQASLIWLV